jgi:hypothetical protein
MTEGGRQRAVSGKQGWVILQAAWDAAGFGRLGYLLSVICYLLSVICYLLSVICYLLSVDEHGAWRY